MRVTDAAPWVQKLGKQNSPLRVVASAPSGITQSVCASGPAYFGGSGRTTRLISSALAARIVRCKPAPLISATRLAGRNLLISSRNDLAVGAVAKSSNLCLALAWTSDVP